MAVTQAYQAVFDNELYPDVYSKAGILFINLAKKHPFYNGNKRTAWTAMDVYFKANSYQMTFMVEEALMFILKVVNFEGSFEELKEWVFLYLRNSERIESA